MSATVYAKNSLLDLAFGSVAYTPPSTYYLGLSTTAVYASGSGATEPVGYGYARVSLTNDKTIFSYSASGCILNSGSITFPTTSGSWGTVAYAFLASASASGSVLYYTQLAESLVVQTSTTLTISPCALAFSIT
jgi:hypothetical protein